MLTTQPTVFRTPTLFFTLLHISLIFSVFHHTRAVRCRQLPSLRDGSLLPGQPKCRGPPVERCPPETLLSSGGRLRHRDCGRGGRGAEKKRARVQEQRQPHSRGLLGVYSYQVKVPFKYAIHSIF